MVKEQRRGRDKLTPIDLFEKEVRQEIWVFLKDNPKQSISQIEIGLKINRGTLKHHLAIMKRAGLIDSVKEEHLAGKPVLFFIPEKKNDSTLEILKELKKGTGYPAIIEKLSKKLNLSHIKVIADLTTLEIEGAIKKDYVVTSKGDEILKQNG